MKYGIIRPVRPAGFRDCAGRARDATGNQRQRIAASTQWRPAVNLASKLTRRSTEILPLFQDKERHESGDAPDWAHCLFMYPCLPVVGLL